MSVDWYALLGDRRSRVAVKFAGAGRKVGSTDLNRLSGTIAGLGLAVGAFAHRSWPARCGAKFSRRNRA